MPETGKSETKPADVVKTASGASTVLTEAEARVAIQIIDKIVAHALQDAIVGIVKPAIRRAILEGITEIASVNAGKKPGGGQEGGTSSENRKPEGP